MLALRVVIGLAAGFLLGLALAAWSPPGAAALVWACGAAGGVFVNLIRMTAIPLIVSMLVASAGTMGSAGPLGRTGVRAAVLAVVLLAAASAGAALVARPAFARLPIDAAAAAALRAPEAAATAGADAALDAPTVSQWLLDLVPPNVLKAAADGAMVPVILFAVLFALALARVAPAVRDPLVRAAEGSAGAMQRLVGWILGLAPIGVFALAVPLAARLGWSAVGAVGAYVGLVVALTVAAGLVLLYPLGIWFGPMPARAFVSYCAPSQAIAFASRSSLAALPAMVESAERAGLPSETARLVMPLALGVFHVGAAVAQTVGALFLACLFGVPLAAPQIVSIVVAVLVASVAVPGVPGGSIIAMVPVLAAARLPMEGIGILLAVDTIPDMFRTAANVTGALTLAAVVPLPPAAEAPQRERPGP